jgi:hypothetical protein
MRDFTITFFRVMFKVSPASVETFIDTRTNAICYH